MKYLITILVLWFSQVHLTAQAPGYQGKKLYVEAGINIFPSLPIVIVPFFPSTYSWIGPSLNAQNKGQQSFPFENSTGHFIVANRYNFSLNYVLSRKLTVKLGYDYSVAGSLVFLNTPSITSPTLTDEQQLFYQLHLNDFNLSLGVMKTKKEGIAPLGFYWEWGLRFLFVNGNLRDQRVNYADNSFPDHTPREGFIKKIAPQPMFFMLGLTTQTGYRTVLADKITFNVSVQFTVFPQVLTALIGGGFDRKAHTNTATYGVFRPYTPYQYQVIKTVSERYWTGIQIGVGALLY